MAPTLRCHMPGTGRALLTAHTDAEFHHPPTELNGWLPLTTCYDTNTLWLELARGLALRYELQPFHTCCTRDRRYIMRIPDLVVDFHASKGNSSG